MPWTLGGAPVERDAWPGPVSVLRCRYRQAPSTSPSSSRRLRPDVNAGLAPVSASQERPSRTTSTASRAGGAAAGGAVPPPGAARTATTARTHVTKAGKHLLAIVTSPRGTGGGH